MRKASDDARDVSPPGQAYKTYRLGGKMSELLYSPATYGIDLSHKDTPRPRALFH